MTDIHHLVPHPAPQSDITLFHNPARTDAPLIDFRVAQPILVNRPKVVTPLRTRLCRPSEGVLDIPPSPPSAAHPPPMPSPTQEDGQVVIDAKGQRVAA